MFIILSRGILYLVMSPKRISLNCTFSTTVNKVSFHTTIPLRLKLFTTTPATLGCDRVCNWSASCCHSGFKTPVAFLIISNALNCLRLAYSLPLALSFSFCLVFILVQLLMSPPSILSPTVYFDLPHLCIQLLTPLSTLSFSLTKDCATCFLTSDCV